MSDIEHGLKRLTLDNWLVPSLAQHMADGETIREMTQNDWASIILGFELDASVPVEVQRLFSVAKACLLYGAFYYPLYTLGAEQLFRVVDAATAHKCILLGRNNKRDTFKDRIDFLVSNGTISAADEAQWDAIRRFRNAASHADEQSILTAGFATSILNLTNQQINQLFV